MTYNGLDEVLGWIDRWSDMKKHRYAGCIVAIALTPSRAIFGRVIHLRFLYDLLHLFARSHFYPQRLFYFFFFFAVDIAFVLSDLFTIDPSAIVS